MRAHILSRSFTFLMFLLMVAAVVASNARAENTTGAAYPTVQIDTGHLALETCGQEIADLMRDFLNRKVSTPSVAAR